MQLKNRFANLDHYGGIKIVLNSDTGEVDLTLYEDQEGEKPVFNTTCKLRKKRNLTYTIRFTVDKHPETGEKADFTGLLHRKTKYGRWSMHIYPQYGEATITQHELIVETEGMNEFFS